MQPYDSRSQVPPAGSPAEVPTTAVDPSLAELSPDVGAWTRPQGYLPTSRLGMMPPGASSQMLAQAAASPVAPSAPGAMGQGRIEYLLEALVQMRGSDLLLSVGTPPQARIDGVLRPLRREPCGADEISMYVRELVDDTRLTVLQQYRSVDFAFSGRGRGHGRFRGNVYYAQGCFSVALRHLPDSVPQPEQIGVPPSVVRMSEQPHGLVLVTGPTGSGKSTTIASLLQRINMTRPCHIVTIEDPIEFVFGHGQAVVDQREIGWDALTFADALRSVLREDPDVVLVGEMRDLESMSAAMTVAETGHLVFATLHTNDAPQAVDRLVDAFGAEQQGQIRAQLASSLLGVVHQRLLPRQAGGRVAAFEVLVVNDPVRNLIREGKTNQIRNVMLQSVSEGMITLDQYIGQLHDGGYLP